MLKDAWDDYALHAWGENELKPVSQTGQSGGIFGDTKIGATIIDALDTLYIMELNEEFQRGRDWVADELSFENLVSIHAYLNQLYKLFRMIINASVH